MSNKEQFWYYDGLEKVKELTRIGNLTFVPRRALCFVATSTTLPEYWGLDGRCWYSCKYSSEHESWRDTWFPHSQGTGSRFDAGLTATEGAIACCWWEKVEMSFGGGLPSTYKIQEAHEYELSSTHRQKSIVWQSGWVHKKNTDNALGILPTRIQLVDPPSAMLESARCSRIISAFSRL